MKLKKTIALLLCLLMALSLAACGGGGEKTPAAESPAAPGEAPAAEEPAAEEPAAVGEPVNLVVSSAYKDTDAEGLYLNYFMEQCTKNSGGTITFTKYMAGTVGGIADELPMLRDGDVDIIAMFAPAYAFELPEFTFILNAMGSIDKSMEFFHYICYDNPETAQLYSDAIAAYNGKLLGGVFAVGRTMFPCAKAVTGWDDLRANLKIGYISSTASQFGYKNFVVINNADSYENLRTGLCDCVELGVDSVLAMKLYEVADCFLTTDIYSPFEHMVMNSDSFDSLSAEQQEIVLQAAKDTEAYSVQCCNEAYDELLGILDGQGATVVDMSESEAAEYWETNVTVNYASLYYGLAAATGKEAQAATIINTIMDYWQTGYTVETLREFFPG